MGKEEEILTVSAPKDWKTEEKSKQEDAKKKAAEVMKKLRETGPSNKKTAGSLALTHLWKKYVKLHQARKKEAGNPIKRNINSNVRCLMLTICLNLKVTNKGNVGDFQIFVAFSEY